MWFTLSPLRVCEMNGKPFLLSTQPFYSLPVAKALVVGSKKSFFLKHVLHSPGIERVYIWKALAVDVRASRDRWKEASPFRTVENQTVSSTLPVGGHCFSHSSLKAQVFCHLFWKDSGAPAGPLLKHGSVLQTSVKPLGLPWATVPSLRRVSRASWWALTFPVSSVLTVQRSCLCWLRGCPRAASSAPSFPPAHTCLCDLGSALYSANSQLSSGFPLLRRCSPYVACVFVNRAERGLHSVSTHVSSSLRPIPPPPLWSLSWPFF